MSDTIDLTRRQEYRDPDVQADPDGRRSAGRVERLESAATTIKQAREALREVAQTIHADIKVRRNRSAADQRLRSIVPVTQPMMLCSQVQRSGGTLLSRLFDGHPACFAHPSELRWGRPEKWHWPMLDRLADGTPEALLGQLDEGWPRQFAAKGYHKYSEWTHRHEPEVMEYYPFVFDEDLQHRIFAALMARQPPRSQRECLDAYLTSLFNAWLDYQNLYQAPKQWVTAFVPRLVMEADGPHRFFADYPDGLLVTLVREPRGWLSSFTRHVATDDVDTAIDQWLESAASSVRAEAARPDRVVVLLFEDVVHRTEAVVRRLCKQMGLSFDARLLAPTFNSMPVLSDSSYVLTRGIDAAVTDRHRTSLTSAQAERVARRATQPYEEIRARFGLTDQEA